MLTSEPYWIPRDSTGYPLLSLCRKVPDDWKPTPEAAGLVLAANLRDLAEGMEDEELTESLQPFPQFADLLVWVDDPQQIPGAVARTDGAYSLLLKIDWSKSKVESLTEEQAAELGLPVDQTFGDVLAMMS